MKLTYLISAFFLSIVVLPTSVSASGGGVELKSADIDVHNQPSLQRGAKYFVNYCQGCHSLKFSRYNRVAVDIGLTDDQVKDNLIFTRDENGDPTKVGGLMISALDEKGAAKWFGAPPPDLSLVGRSRSADWIYTYLNSFYADPSRPMGVNNLVFPNVGMPHVLADLQGLATLHEAKKDEHGDAHAAPTLRVATAGSLHKSEYEAATRDITNFLVYVSEPAQLHRKGYGIWVLLFLGVFFIFAYLLKKEYWKDVH